MKREANEINFCLAMMTASADRKTAFTKNGDVAELAAAICVSESRRPLLYYIRGGNGTVNEALQGIDDTAQASESH